MAQDACENEFDRAEYMILNARQTGISQEQLTLRQMLRDVRGEDRRAYMAIRKRLDELKEESEEVSDKIGKVDGL